MTRPQIEFIQTQAVAWHTLGENASRPGAEVKILSSDLDTNAVSVILRYAQGWALNQAHYVESAEELFVLSGALMIGGVTYGKGDYAYLPAGFARKDMSSPEGADVLTFFEGAHKRIAGPAPEGLYQADLLVERIATESVTWGGATDPKVAAPGVRRLGLRSRR